MQLDRRTNASPPIPTDSAERRLDGLLHAAALGASAMGVAVLIWTGLRGLALLPFLSVVVYAIGLVTTFAVSASYHRSVRARHREILRRLDQAFIFIMIAATYTPFAVISLGVAGRWLLAGVWAVAAIGVALKLMMPRRLERVAILVYLSQGWMGLLAIEPLVAALPVATLVLLGAGGLLYTIGVVFHLWQRLIYQNLIWHLFVVSGAACHYVAILTVASGAT